jgi:hypothetical protein
MNVRRSVLGEIASRHGAEIRGIDLGVLLRRLLLFDVVVVQSVRLLEIPPLIRAFGRAGFMELFQSGILKISCESRGIITATARDGVPSLPPSHFTFGNFEIGDRVSVLRKNLCGLQGIPGLGNAQRQTLEDTIVAGLARPGPDYNSQLLGQIELDIRNNSPALRIAVARRLTDELGRSVPSFRIHVEEREYRIFHIVTDLGDVCGFSEKQTHDVLQSSVSAIANLNQRVADMSAYSSIACFEESEAPLLFGKLTGVLAQFNPKPIEGEFERVVAIASLPDFVPGKRLDVEKLLRARESPECAEFRSWLTTLDRASDEQIADMVRGLRRRLGSLVSSGPGKILRLAATTAIGLLGIPLGVAAGTFDSFLIDRILPSSGVVAFLTKTYPSLFVAERRFDV